MMGNNLGNNQFLFIKLTKNINGGDKVLIMKVTRETTMF